MQPITKFPQIYNINQIDKNFRKFSSEQTVQITSSDLLSYHHCNLYLFLLSEVPVFHTVLPLHQAYKIQTVHYSV